MVLLGCTPKGRLTEQHDIFFGIGKSVLELKREMYGFWPDGGQLHVDCWREVTQVDGYSITIVPKEDADTPEKLFFLNLGGYRPGEFEEYHYKMLAVAPTMGKAIKASKKTAFYKEWGFKGAESHVDEKYALDVDDMHKVEDLFSDELKARYSIRIEKKEGAEDELHIGYLKLGKR
ncbi:DUF1543 domain-containing protein [Flavobacterium album]|uniref:DUF1543 domain-containing protein n=2 Tax=Flavobacterium album TaxID=2175091 RepID=A0A2S1R332_9FLAO|nr:DUF1543 domain-containing protein [Flavobacterium album]